ncbi:hypothetical protein E1301_Tti022795 [Triplophysa tibetana]|uniref:TNFR-Cys domain-containing protein n=1 Tax=Triplophysa tibetana TaxID=1572043 RepID=A0A5A9P0B5_9TELE|nr:hypothetical protein E1301_Tti022795 [Triplophysa tibetana]
MMGIAKDGASVMVGKNHSVFTLLKQIQPNLQLIRCVCHSLDIVANKAMQLLPSNIEYMVRETYNWFVHSAKRQYEYKNIYETINNGGCPLKLISPSCTGWLVMADCINRIVDQKDALTLHFNMASSTEHCYTARLLKEMYNDKTNLLYMYFLQPVLMEIKAVNKCFQLETGNSLGVFRDLERLYMTTVRRILKPIVLRNHKQLRELDLTQSGIFLSPLDADLGTTFMDKLEESRLAPDMKERISSRCMDFLKELVKQYQLRLPASMEILSKLELFCPKSVMSTINRPGETVFIGIAQKIPVQLVFRALNQLTLITPMALFNVFPALCVMQEGFYCIDKNKYSCTLAVKHIECRPGQYIKQAGTAYTDTACAKCSDGFYSDGTLLACQPHSKCSIKGLIEIKAGTTSTDVECGKSSPVGLVIGVTVGVSYATPSQNDLEPTDAIGFEPTRCRVNGWSIFVVPRRYTSSTCPARRSTFPGRRSTCRKTGLDYCDHNCSVLPNDNNLKKILEEIAHKEMVQQPKSIKFPLKMSPSETVVSNHLLRFIRERDQKELILFLRYCTGCDTKGLTEIKAGTTSTDAECRKSTSVALIVGVVLLILAIMTLCIGLYWILKRKGLYIQSQCTTIKDTVCDVLDGYHCTDYINSQCQQALKHSVCEPGQEIKTPGTKTADTDCEVCPLGFYSPTGVNCTIWTDCSAKNEIETKAGSSITDVTCIQQKRNRYSIIAAVSAAVIPVAIIYFLGSQITQWITTRRTKMKQLFSQVKTTNSPTQAIITSNMTLAPFTTVIHSFTS